MLHNVGVWCHDHRRLVVVLWIAALLLGNGMSRAVGDAYGQKFLLPGLESTLAVLVFASTAFAPAENMPGWLQAYNRVQPVSVVVRAMRVLCLGGPTATPLFHAVLWMAVLVAVFAPLAVRGYRTVK